MAARNCPGAEATNEQSEQGTQRCCCCCPGVGEFGRTTRAARLPRGWLGGTSTEGHQQHLLSQGWGQSRGRRWPPAALLASRAQHRFLWLRSTPLHKPQEKGVEPSGRKAGNGVPVLVQLQGKRAFPRPRCVPKKVALRLTPRERAATSHSPEGLQLPEHRQFLAGTA